MSAVAASSEALVWRTHETTVSLARALLVNLTLTLFSGLALWLDAGHAVWLQWLLVMHLACGLLSLLLAAPYVWVHLRDGREPWRALLWPLSLWRAARQGSGWPRKRLIGHGLLWAFLLANATGLVMAWPGMTTLLGEPQILPLGSQAWLLAVHRWAMPMLLLAAGIHLARWRKRLLTGATVTLVLGLLAAVLLPVPVPLGVDVAKDMPTYSRPFGDNPFEPGAWRTSDDKLLNWRAMPSAQQCASCHHKEFMEWNTSLHSISDKDVIYDSSVQRNVEKTLAASTHGEEKGRWCESCHNPLGTLTGAVTPFPSLQETTALEEGVSCVVCHTSDHARPLEGNGALTSRLNELVRMPHSALLAAAPSRHVKDMQAVREAPEMARSALCGACHTEIRHPNVSGSEPMHFQDTYEEWQRSPWADKGVQCQGCHMANDPAGAIDALAKGQKPPGGVSHRLVGANHLLTMADLPLLDTLRGGAPPGINRLFDQQQWRLALNETSEQSLALLRAAAELKLRWIDGPSGADRLRVTVTNKGAGHALPTGPLDQRHMWLEVKVMDASGHALLHSGRFDADKGRLDPDAVTWVKEMRDAKGRLDRHHLLFDVTNLHHPRKPIEAGQSQDIDYPVTLPGPTAGPLVVEVKLWYRLGFQEILENLEEAGMPAVRAVIPPVLMTQATLKGALTRGGGS